MSDHILAVWPNPTTGFVKIKTENIGKVSVINPLGQCIYEGEVSEFDFGGHDAGIYIIRIETASGVTTKKSVPNEMIFGDL